MRQAGTSTAQAASPSARHRAEYHLNSNLQSAGNSTWMFDPQANGDPVQRTEVRK